MEYESLLICVEYEPDCRNAHIATVWNDVMYIWGDHVSNTCAENHHNPAVIWKYNILRKSWLKHTVDGYFPKFRTGSCAALLGCNLFVFGGVRSVRDISDFVFGGICLTEVNDLNKLNLSTLEWELIQPSGAPPSKRRKCACISFENRLIFFGGFGPRPEEDQLQNGEFDNSLTCSSYGGWNNHLFAYETATNQWIPLANDGDRPSSRAAHCLAKNGRKAYLHGGRHLGERLDDFYELSLETYTWTFISCMSIEKPIGRTRHTLTSISSDEIFLFGGVDNSNNVLSDGWLYNTTTKTWLKVRDGEHPRQLLTVCSGPCPGEVLVFSGCKNNMTFCEEKHTNNVIIFNFQPKPLQRICLEHLAKDRETWRNLPLHLKSY
ncbi:kelch domain-containing protein 2-like isoform X1 [Clavelina lepadiformis]|uniref:kelch domain-containing protein 2-like isoform X1 n=1 Tax=Clavelina lepadiformis TaxID=159417 RepID=UPI004041227E